MEMEIRLKRAVTASFITHFIIVLMMMTAHQLDWPMSREQERAPLIIEVVDPAKKQIVQSQKGQLVDEAAPDSFLGKENRIVEKQTQGKTAQLSMQQQKQAQAKQEARQETQMESPPLRKFGVPLLAPRKDAKPIRDVNPNWTDFAKAHRGEVDPDYVTGIDQANETALNTREFVFYGYFERIRSRLNQAWKPLLRDHIIKFYRQGRSIASDQDHITRVLVVLNDNGDIVEVKVLEKSGTRVLDESAVRAFNRAGPFPNPPKGLMNEKKEIEIRWDFILKS